MEKGILINKLEQVLQKHCLMMGSLHDEIQEVIDLLKQEPVSMEKDTRRCSSIHEDFIVIPVSLYNAIRYALNMFPNKRVPEHLDYKSTYEIVSDLEKRKE